MRRILLIEDDLDGQEMLKAILEHLDFVVDTADDGDQAAALLFEMATDYEAVLMDLALPGKDGWQLLDEIRSHPQTQSLPCIAVTAFHNPKLRETALQAGFTSYLPKPLDSNTLAREIQKLIG